MIPKFLFVVLVFYLTTEIIAEEYFSLNENVQDPEIISRFTRPKQDVKECILLNENDQHIVKLPNGTTGPKRSSSAQPKTEEDEKKKPHKPKRESEEDLEEIKNPNAVSYGQPTNDIITLSRSKLSSSAAPQSGEDKTKPTGAPRDAEVCILLDESDQDLELIKSPTTPKRASPAQPKMDKSKKRKDSTPKRESEQNKTSSKAVPRGHTSKRASSAQPKKGEDKKRKNGSPKELITSLDERDQDSEQGETSHGQTPKTTVRPTRSKQVSPAQSKTNKGKKSKQGSPKLDAEKYISLDKTDQNSEVIKTSKAVSSKSPTKPKAQQKKGVTQKQNGKKYSSLEKPDQRSKDTTKSDRPKRFVSQQKTKTKKEKTVDRAVKTKSKGNKFGKDRAGRY